MIESGPLEGKWLEGRIEPVDERFLHLEIMKARFAVNIARIALHQPIERRVRRDRVLRLRRRLFVLGKGRRRQGQACGDAARELQEVAA